MKGWIYLITNPVMWGLVKVGYSSKDPEIRARDFYKQNTGMPAQYKVQYKALLENALEVEAKVHEILDNYREVLNKNETGKEWFRCSLLIAYQAIQQASGYSSIVYDEKSDELLSFIEQLNNRNKSNKPIENWLLKLENETRKSGCSNVFIFECPIATLREIEAARQHLEGAFRHDPKSQYQLGLLYLRGSKPIRNAGKTVEWLIKSSLNRYKPAKEVILRQTALFSELIKNPNYKIFSNNCLNEKERLYIQEKLQEQNK